MKSGSTDDDERSMGGGAPREVRAGRDAIDISSQRTGDITTGPSQTTDLRQDGHHRSAPELHSHPVQTVTNQPSITVNAGTGGVAIALVLILFAGVIGFSILQLRDRPELFDPGLPEPVIEPGEEGTEGPPPSTKDPDKAPTNDPTEAPQRPKVPIEAIVSGRSWVVAVEGSTTGWQSLAARAYADHLRAADSEQNLGLLPSALHPHIEALLALDPAVAPGSGRSLGGVETVYALILDIEERIPRHSPTTAVLLTCEAMTLSLRGPSVTGRRVSNHTGQAATASGALQMALSRCLSDFVDPS